MTWRPIRKWMLPATLAAVVAGGGAAADDGPPQAPSARPAQSQPMPIPEGVDPEVARALRESWPDRPEWVDMLADILQGSQLGPYDGWFRTAVTRTRFTWDATRGRYDADHDGQVARREFPGPDADFARLDNDRDGALTAADFDFSAPALMPSVGASFFARADRDGNGKVTPEEFNALFRAFDVDDRGFLAQQDVVGAFTPPARPARPPGPAPAPTGPDKATLVRGLFRQEIGSLQPGPALDAPAPDFTLKTADGRSSVTLSGLIGPKPVVLIFGNFTCGPFRSMAGNLDKLHQRYKDRATFVMVYVREAHPVDGWRMESNDRVGVTLAQPTTYDERVAVARTCGRQLDLGFPMLVDTIDDRVGAEYSGMPGRFYLIDRDGKVAFKNGRGPFGFKPAELEQSLVLLLADHDARPAAPTPSP